MSNICCHSMCFADIFWPIHDDTIFQLIKIIFQKHLARKVLYHRVRDSGEDGKIKPDCASSI